VYLADNPVVAHLKTIQHPDGYLGYMKSIIPSLEQVDGCML
jgi:hypothetical protein